MISQSIGWTLIHSLWQGLIIYLLFKVVLRLSNRSDFRYGAGVVSLSLMVVSSVITFFSLNKTGSSTGFDLVINATITATGESSSSLQAALQFIDNNIVWLLRFWMLGFVAGILRIAAGLFYINRLRRNATPVQDEWMHVVKDLSESLNISRIVTMAEAAISSPMVVGFMKPMILFPVGLLSGLTIEQVETILVHELAHIRRQDYIINLIQSLVETAFFFNPFVLLISALIREERENCCDDLVIAKGVSPISYVKTLAQLEAVESSNSLVLGIAGNQNQLLNRIKRIMENSAKNDWGKGRLVPVALLFLGLICASWMTIGADKKSEKKEIKGIVKETTTNPLVLVKDTIIYQVLEVDKTQPAEIELIDIPEVPEIAEITIDFPDVEFNFFDTIPDFRHDDFDVFEQQFKEKFKSQFKEFYSKNQQQFDKMFDEMKLEESSKRREAAEMVDLEQMARHNNMIAKQFSFDAKDFELEAREFAKMAARQKVEIDKFQREILNEQLLSQKFMIEDMTSHFEDFKKAIAEQLVSDGYVKPGESINNININDNDEKMIINGIAIKEKDRIKYQAIQDKYFKPNHFERQHCKSE